MSQGGPKPTSFYVERQALTRSPATPTPPNNLSSNFAAGQNAPAQGTTTPGDGLVLGGIFAVTVSIYPWAGQTLSGSGFLLCWIYNPYQAFWTRCPDFDFNLTGSSGFQAQTFAPIKEVSRLGMLVNWLTSSVTVSGGSTDVLVRIDGFQSVLGMST